MPYDYSKLSGIIVEKFGTRGAFADKIGMSERTLSLKMNGKVEWKQNEIYSACQLLGISDDQITDYFFAIKVQ